MLLALVNTLARSRLSHQVILLWAGILWALGIGWPKVAAQTHSIRDRLQFEHLSDQDGVPPSLVWSIHQDKEGFMWFGTWRGLVKYHGQGATLFKADPIQPTRSLRSTRIWDIHEDRKGRIWLATNGGGLHLLDKRTGKVTPYPVDNGQDPRWNLLGSVFEDERGWLWLGTGLGIARFDPVTKRYTFYPTPNEQFIDCLQADAQGKLWGVTPAGLLRFDRRTGEFSLFPIHWANGLPNARAFHLDEDGTAWVGTFGAGLFRLHTQRLGHFTPYNPKGLVGRNIWRAGIHAADGYLWVATSEGLQRINPKTDQVIAFASDPAMPASLSSNFVTATYKDRMGNLWVGTINGVNRTSTTVNPFYTHQIIPTPEPFFREENVINSILEDHHGLVWVGSAAKGLYQFNPRTHQFTHVVVNPKDTSKLSDQEGSFVEDLQGQLWVGTDMEKGLYLLDRVSGKFIRYSCEIAVRRLAVDRSGKLWIGGRYDGIASFDPATKRFTYYKASEKDATRLIPGNINAILVSRKGDIWVATTRGICRLDLKTRLFARYHLKDPAPTSRWQDYNVLSLFEDQAGIMWAGMYQGGLCLLNPATGTFSYFTTGQGLPSNTLTVASIISDQQGNVWLGTDQGLCRYTPSSHTFRFFDERDGLPANNLFYENCVYRRHGKLLFGTRKGFVIFYPDSLKDLPATPPPVYITGWKVLEKSRPVPTEPVNLAYDENFLSFEFVALQYEAPEKNQYAYRLAGLEKDWIYSGNRRYASYTDLAPGTYLFQVKASSDGRVWNRQGASFNITIRPPLWKTWWAYALYTLTGVAALLGLRHYLVTRERLKSDLKLQRIEAEHMHELDKLKSHFFANISHEFRTPLSLIKGTAEKLQKKGESPANLQQDALLINRNADRVLDLINQLLDLSKLEAGKMALQPEPTEITAFLTSLAGSLVSLFESKGVHYRYSVPLTPGWVFIDKDKLEKILSNLLSNAYKFTPPAGEVRVSISLETTGITHCNLHVTVEDTGIGIPADKLPRIFERFHQVDSSPTRSYEGTGIGLALTKELVELQRGTIRVESTEGKGTTFSVVLPLEVALPVEAEVSMPREVSQMPAMSNLNQPAAETEVFSPDDKARKGRHGQVLLVEDNADLRQFLRENLLGEYQIWEASDGQRGLDQALEIIPDLIISDVMMPGMDGVTLCSKLKSDERTSHIPLILLTAKADTESKLKGLETGADEYLTKPFKLEELQVRVKNLIEQRRQLRERFGKQITLKPQEVAVTSMDERFLQKALTVVEANLGNADFDVEAFGKEIGLGRSQLHRKLTALTGQAPSEFIRNLRLQRAAYLLRKRQGNVAEVALLVGFASQSYFTKCFREVFGQTPSEYVLTDSQ